ncbi:MAG TPA: oligosaccharyl transferase, archaeosortase A system-associated [Methanoregulaceae archaeon]|nr:oligosaccharyl transferase, archaeosortase A system-associated [Methanoregulaceae archaeon]
MFSLPNKNSRTILIIVSIIFFSLFALYLRLIPLFNLGSTDILNIVASDDPMYNLRQTELLLHNFPTYAWFEPMTHFPYGDSIYWGPLFTYILAGACMISGATTRPEIIGTTLLVPPILATILVPIMYYVGKHCGDWKTGLFASGFTAVVSGQYFYRSYVGYLDHHIAEVFFATTFCLLYIYALESGKEAKVRFSDTATLKRPVLIALLTGIAYLLGLFTMPTMILFAMIVAIFTVCQCIIDHYRGDSLEYLVLINSVVFAVVIVPFLLFGIRTSGIDLANYSIGHIYAYFGLIMGTLALYGLNRALEGRNRHLYPLALAGLGVIASLLLLIVSPTMFTLLVSSFFAFFGQGAESLTVQEARGWDIGSAWAAFSYGLILMMFGFLVLVYKNFREEHPYQIFAIVWSAVILVSTWQHIRYEYYLAINIALLSAVVVSFAIDLSWRELSRLVKNILPQPAPSEPAIVTEQKKGKKQKKERVKQAERKVSGNLATLAILIFITALAILFVINSVGYSYTNAYVNPIVMNPDWRESLEWLGNNTPDTGVDYYKIYEKETFRYPDSAYGVMSWWDYGHLITYIAKRIPNANPFQQGVAGENGAAAFFMTTSEGSANSILDNLGTKYVITDYEMDVGKFWAMATWFNASQGINPYEMYFAVSDPDNPTSYNQLLLNNATYYQTMVSRLHNFDGSMGVPTTAYYIEYADSSLTQISIPLVTRADAMNASDARALAAQYNLNPKAGYHAIVMNPVLAVYAPIEPVQALHNYRLIHESPTNIYESSTVDIRYVKVFEYVKGARIKGNGTIEVPVVTNTGRAFTYRQESVNGEFIVPYSTRGATYEVRTTGKYRISGTTKEFDVPEEAVEKGLTIT